MAIPSGSGTEVFKLSVKDGVSGDTNHVMITGVANHIYIIKTITVSEIAGNPEEFSIMAGAVHVMYKQELAGYGCFVWNDTIVVSGATNTIVRVHDSATIDITCSYIDQDFT